LTDRTLAADIDRVRRQVLRAGAAGALASAGCLAGEFPTGSGPDTTKGPSSTKTTGPGAGGGDAVATFTYELAEAGLVGRVRDVIVACDKVAWPAQAWTTDGLYAGYFLDDRVDDGLPNTVYHWLWAPADDGSRKDAIVNADNEAEGTVIEHDGDVYWFVNGWQNEVVYRIHGWDDFTRTEATASIDEEPPTRRTRGPASTAPTTRRPTCRASPRRSESTSGCGSCRTAGTASRPGTGETAST
jgi:hypothetical protein